MCHARDHGPSGGAAGSGHARCGGCGLGVGTFGFYRFGVVLGVRLPGGCDSALASEASRLSWRGLHGLGPRIVACGPLGLGRRLGLGRGGATVAAAVAAATVAATGPAAASRARVAA